MLEHDKMYDVKFDADEGLVYLFHDKEISIPSTSAGPGTIIQTIQTTSNTQQDIISATFVNSNLTGSITPGNAANKVLITACFPLGATGNGSGVATIARNGVNIGGTNYGFGLTSPTGDIGSVTLVFLDSPMSTGSITYTIQVLNDNGGSVRIGERDTTQVLLLQEVKG